MSEGIADELEGISLGDERLNQRSLKVIEALAADPTASINAATNGWADTQAAYRLFNNRKASPEQTF
ncbi:MAG: transposase [Planctomycetaceae bacterium]